MNRILSNIIENTGIEVFKIANREKSDPEVFQNCQHFDGHNIQSLYSKIQVFERCNNYNMPCQISTRHYNEMQVSTFRMGSMYNPIHIFQKQYDSFLENKHIYFEKIKNIQDKKAEKICMIYLHGFSERNYELETKYLFSKIVAEIPGLEVLAVHLPYHMKRSPKSQPYSGAYIFDSYPIVTIEGFRQAVHDVSQVLSYARESYKSVIVGGFSLGGLVTSLLGTCDDRGDLYLMGQAGAHIPRTLKDLRVCPGLIAKKKRWMKQGIDFESLYAPIELLHYEPLVSKEKVISIAGVYDKLIRFEDAEKLRHFYKSFNNIDYCSGHIGFLLETKEVMEEVKAIIDGLIGGGKSV